MDTEPHSQEVDKTTIIYTAEFVKDKNSLVETFPPKHQKVYGHHSTIAFKPSNLDGIEVGKEFKMKIVGRVSDEKGDALLVENPKSNNQHPHITLSCAEKVSPVYSNEMINKAIEMGTVEFLENPIEIDVIEGYFDGKKDVVN